MIVKMSYKLVLSVVSHILIYTNAQLVPIPANTNLKQIIMLVRHGVTAPLYSYPTDPYGPSYWERYGGLGQITSRGLFESYILGQFFKNYYVNFLTPAYSPTRVHVRSLDNDASLMSAMSFLSGMYPPANSDQLWSPQISWFPIPVHTDQRYLDPIFVEDCAKFDALVQTSLSTQAYANIQAQYAAFIKNMTQLTGLPQLSYVDLWKLYDNAISKANNGLPLEPWLSEAFQTLAAANDFRVNLRYGDINKAKLVSGALLFDISKQIRRKTAGSTNELYIYSCEDSHISSLLTLLNASTNSHLDQVPFSSVLILELSQDTSGLYYVTVRMQSNTTALPVGLIPMNISSCGQTCSLGNFFDLNARNMISSNLREVCSMGNSSSSSSTSNGGESTVTTKFPTSGCVLPGTNGTVYPYYPKKGYSQLELTLIIICSVLGAIILALIIMIGLICYRNKIRKASF